MKQIKKIAYPHVIGPELDSREAEKTVREASKGNIQARLHLIMHNQLIINNKLNKLLGENIIPSPDVKRFIENHKKKKGEVVSKSVASQWSKNNKIGRFWNGNRR